MTRYTDEQIAAGARVAFDALYGVDAWKKPPISARSFTYREWQEAFSAGLATLPNHTAELLETIDKMREIDRIMERLDWYAEHGPAETHGKLCKQLDTLAAQIATAIANAKAQTKGGSNENQA